MSYKIAADEYKAERLVKSIGLSSVFKNSRLWSHKSQSSVGNGTTNSPFSDCVQTLAQWRIQSDLVYQETLNSWKINRSHPICSQLVTQARRPLQAESIKMDIVYFVFHKLRYMFYLVPPSETMYEHSHQVPRYVVEVRPGWLISNWLIN